ncbi:hypothetical protein MKW94_019285 [Papaver nudicaule]|uniref:ABC transporter domain-containing protein n=1 Tax=Papaver nudicaule TaxID=74823 RepID=A0AA41S4W2_PAPNU|nr:hypothetical protein [Papaver nudicaule]
MELVDVTTSSATFGYGGGEIKLSEDMELHNHDACTTTVERPTTTSVLPPSLLSFHNLTYSVKINRKLKCFRPKNDTGLGAEAAEQVADIAAGARSTSSDSKLKFLLNDISGEAKEGEMLAILGGSGSGKSTLIDALANRISKGSLKGSVTLNGEILESRLLKKLSAYVMQDDLLFPMLTVEETLMYSADFRLPCSHSTREKNARVQAVIDQLGLQNAANTRIGDESHRGVSGGERRRVSIGIGIIHSPIILFLDEPTSGLDSTSAFQVCKVLQSIAQSGSIVIMSVHQPSYRLLGLLSHLIILSRGEAVYKGSPASLLPFFSEFGHPIHKNENKTEFVLDLVRELEGSPGGVKNLVEFNRSWQKKMKSSASSDTFSLSLRDAASACHLASAATSNNDDISTGSMSTFANPFWIEIIVLAKRSFKNSNRQPEVFGMRLGAILLTGFTLATIFWQLDDSPRSVQERLGFYTFTMAACFYLCADVLPVYLQNRSIYIREAAYNTYRCSSYVLSNMIVALPSITILSIALAATTFWAVGLSGGFFFFLVTIFSSFWTASSFISFLSGVVPHAMVGYCVTFAILGFYILFCGFFISRDRIPPYWIWFHFLSLFKYPLDGALQNEFYNSSKCYLSGVQMFDGTPFAVFPTDKKVEFLSMLSDASGMNLTATTCFVKGADILRDHGLTDINKWLCILITVAWGFLFRFLWYVCLLFGSKNKRS